MKLSSKRWTGGLVLLAIIASCGLTGCQTSVGGQIMPSGYYLRDDVQFFPAGPEFLLYNTDQQYKERRQGDGDADEAAGDEN